MQARVVIIADDLTGGADTGIQFAAFESPVYLLPVAALSLGSPWMTRAAGLSIHTASRELSPSAAAERVRLAAGTLPKPRPRWIYKKIDSCLRGNLGAEIDALLDTLGLAAALVAPALPAQGRTTVDGIHRIYDTPLAETEFAQDPLTPVTSSSVAEILARQSRYGIGRIAVNAYDELEQLQGAVQRERQRGCRLIVCDATTQAHLDRIAALLVRNTDHLLPVGSAGLAAGMVGQLSSNRMVEPGPAFGLERLLMVCGTAAQVTGEQLDALLDRYPGVHHELAPEWLVTGSARDRRCCADDLLAAWTGGVLALRMQHPLPAGLAVDPEQVAVGLAGLAELAVEILRTGPVDGLFLSGGETADTFRRSSGGEAIELQREVLPGLVLGRWVGGVADGLPVVTKAGAFGEKQTLATLYERLTGRTDRIT